MANELHTFTGNEVIATELPKLLNQNFDYVRENSLKSVNGIEKDENNNVDVTFLTSQVIPTNSDLNNFRESGEYTRELDTIVVANSPTEKPFFLTVLASENLVKQVVTEIDRKDPMTFTRTLSGANWSPWVEGGVDIGIWKSEETVKVGDVRFLKGRENAGYVLECVTAGVTGEHQPVLEGNVAEEVFDLNNFDGTLSIEKGGTGATTASEACANIGALPLSGGSMTGAIISTDGYFVKRDVNDSYLQLTAGTAYSKGAYLYMTGQDNSGDGGFTLGASKDGTIVKLTGKSDGTLAWNGKSIINTPFLPDYSAGVSITFPYTAPEDGFVYVRGSAPSWKYCDLTENGREISFFQNNNNDEHAGEMSGFVHKGSTISMSGITSIACKYFYPLKGGA